MKKLTNENKIIVFDLEATCGKGVDQPEIIEIGAVKIENQRVVADLNILIKPVLNPILTDFCKELTHISQEEVDDGVPFKTACNMFYNWIDSHTKEEEDITYLASWGKYDRKQLNKEIKYNHLLNVFMNIKQINIKGEHGRINNVKKMGLSKAIQFEKLDFVGTPHRALYDAYNAAQILLLHYNKFVVN